MFFDNNGYDFFKTKRSLIHLAEIFVVSDLAIVYSWFSNDIVLLFTSLNKTVNSFHDSHRTLVACEKR
jgi:hypothetical protein